VPYLMSGVALAILLLTGSCVLVLIAPGGGVPSERLPLALVLGAGFVSLEMSWLALIGIRRVFAAALLVQAIVWAAAFLLGTGFRPRSIAPTGGRGIGRWGAVFIAVLVWAVSGVVIGTARRGLGWDGVAVWGLKGKAAFVDGGFPGPYFHDLSRQWSHPDYPLFVPLAEAWVYRCIGQVDECAVKLLFVAFYVALLALFYGGVRREGFTATFSLGFTAALATVPLLRAQAMSGEADVPLALVVFASTLSLYGWLRRGARTDLVLAAVLSALGAWVKKEGSIHWAVNLLAIVALGTAVGRSRRDVAVGVSLFVVAYLAILGPWFAFLSVAPGAGDFVVDLTSLHRGLSRIPVIAGRLVAELMAVRQWGALWLLFAAVTITWRQKLRCDATRVYLLVAALLPLVVLCGAYVFSVWDPFTRHIETSLYRLVLHAVPVAVFLAALQLDHLGAPQRVSVT
jgi:hypothetical protein